MRSMRDTVNLGVLQSTRNARIPWRPICRLIVANVITQSARAPFVTKHFVPFRTQPRPVFLALVGMAVASEPQSGKGSPARRVGFKSPQELLALLRRGERDDRWHGEPRARQSKRQACVGFTEVGHQCRLRHEGLEGRAAPVVCRHEVHVQGSYVI